MNYLKLLLILLISTLSACHTINNTQHPKTVKTTAYTHGESDHLKYGKKTASGTKLRPGVVATDWSVFPLGTKLKINGELYVVEDYGKALVNKSIPVVDIYKPSFRKMNEWGTKMMEIKVVEWGNWSKSKEILSNRLKYSHCRYMYNNIEPSSGGV